MDHNSVRITSAAVVVVCSFLCAWVVLRLTQSLAAASAAHILVFRGLAFFGNEPGHPQELCMVLLLALAASGLLAGQPRTRWVAMTAAGTLAAGLTLIKVNIGIFAILAVAAALLFSSTRNPLVEHCQIRLVGRGLILPAALMRIHLNDPATQAYCGIVTLSVAALAAGAFRFTRPGSLSFRQCWLAAAAFAATGAATLLVLVARGVPLSRVFTMLVLKHLSLNVTLGTWYLPVDLGRIWIAWAMAGTCAAMLVTRDIHRGEGRVSRLLPPFRAWFGGTGLLIAFVSPGLLLGFVTPFCWLLLCPPTDHAQSRLIHARVLLCTVTVLQTLYAYPVAGSQTYFLRILLVLVAAISLLDGLHALSHDPSYAPLLLRFSRPAAAVTLAAVAIAYPVLGYRAERLYASLTPLNMPGAERIHVEPEEAKDYQWLAGHLREHCDTFVGLPGIPSLYFWTGKPSPGPSHTPPGPLNMASWMLTYSPEEQQAVVDDFSQFPNGCAVYSPGSLSFWNKANLDLRTSPLANYILTHFKTVDRTGDYQFMIRNERQLGIPAGGPTGLRPPQ